MVVLMALLGFLLGWLLHWLADWLPRLRSKEQRGIAPFTAPALGQIAHLPREQWLNLGAEVLSTAVLALLWLKAGWSLTFCRYTGAYLFLLLVALIDLKHRLVLNLLIYPAMIVVVLAGRAAPMLFLGGFLAFSMFFLVAWLRPGDVGGGDIKLAALIGLAFGFPHVLWALIIGIGTGGAAAVFLLVSARGNRKSSIAYAPYLCLGAMIALLYNPFKG